MAGYCSRTNLKQRELVGMKVESGSTPVCISHASQNLEPV